MTLSCIFANDDGVEILLPEHPYSHEFIPRDGHEVVFRRINTYFIRKRIVKNSIVDAGCWIGDSAVPWAKNTRGNVYAIDPSPNNCEFVRAVKDLNRLDNLVVLQEALAETRRLVSTDEDLHHCKLNGDDRGKNKLHTTSLDLLWQEGRVKDVGYIHLDVETMEREVILGAQRVIRELRPVLTFEQHLDLDDYAGLIGILKEMKYASFMIDEVLPGCRPDARNFLALPVEVDHCGFESALDSYLGTERTLQRI